MSELSQVAGALRTSAALSVPGRKLGKTRVRSVTGCMSCKFQQPWKVYDAGSTTNPSLFAVTLHNTMLTDNAKYACVIW
jgi:hypothetical protein